MAKHAHVGIWRRFRRWKRRWDFSRLTRSDQQLIRALRLDPDSLIERGEI